MQTNSEVTLGQACPEDSRTGLSVETLKRAFINNLFYVQGTFPKLATQNDYYMALAYMVRDRLLHRWIGSAATYTHQKNSHRSIPLGRVFDGASTGQ